MDVSMDVIIDLLPLYLAGEASAATRALVAQYLRENPELEKRVRAASETRLDGIAFFEPSPELELQSLRTTMRLLMWQRWLFGLAAAFSAALLTASVHLQDGRMQFRFLLQNHPAEMGVVAQLALWFWVGYLVLRHRLRTKAK